jgi:hypothetical protein
MKMTRSSSSSEATYFNVSPRTINSPDEKYEKIQIALMTAFRVRKNLIIAHIFILTSYTAHQLYRESLSAANTKDEKKGEKKMNKIAL